MVKRGVSNKLSGNYILSKIPQEAIFAKYLGLTIEDIEECVSSGRLMQSPIRSNDTDASFGFSYNNKGKLKARDFGGYFWGDCFDAVAFVISDNTKTYNVNVKQDFYLILKHIAICFKDESFKDYNFDAETHITNSLKAIHEKDTIIEFASRDWNINDVDMWGKWGVDINYLNANYVYPVEQYYINRFANPEPKYYYRSNDPCYAYMLGINKNNVSQIKLYSPNRDRSKGRFISNARCLEGMLNVDMNITYDLIILTKSSKDRLSLGCHLEKYRCLGDIKYLVLNMNSEAHSIRDIEFKFLLDRVGGDSTKIISLLDFDTTGRRTAKDMQIKYGIPYIFITNGEFGLSDYDAKDFTELKERYSDEVINQFIYETCETIQDLILKQFSVKQQNTFEDMMNVESFKW